MIPGNPAFGAEPAEIPAKKGRIAPGRVEL